jgi:hypothetical protein
MNALQVELYNIPFLSADKSKNAYREMNDCAHLAVMAISAIFACNMIPATPTTVWHSASSATL